MFRRTAMGMVLMLMSVPVGAVAQDMQTVLDAGDLRGLARAVADEAGVDSVSGVACPDDVALERGAITTCTVDAGGRPGLVVRIEQTDEQGSVTGWLYDPAAAEAFEPLLGAFVDAASTGPADAFHARWLVAGLQDAIDGELFGRLLGCRRQTMGQLSSASVLGAERTADGSAGTLVLRLASRARPVKVVLELVDTPDGWRLNGFNYPLALPAELPPPDRVVERLNRFLEAYAAGDWDRALDYPTVELEMGAPEQRPRAQLALRREMLGRPVETGKASLSFDDRGIIAVRVPVRFENVPGSLQLSLGVCGERLALNGFHIDAQPESPVQVSADYVEQVLALSLWQNGFGEVDVTCTAFDTVTMDQGVTRECRARRGDEVVRAVIEFKSMSGQFEVNMLPVE